MITTPSNPTISEIEEWAYSEEGEPHQEWELFLIWKGEFSDYLKFASDVTCPKESFFLNLLYYWVWRNIKHKAIENELENYESVFEEAKKVNTPYVKLWLERSINLIKDNNFYTEEDWWHNRRPYDEIP